MKEFWTRYDSIRIIIVSLFLVSVWSQGYEKADKFGCEKTVSLQDVGSRGSWQVQLPLPKDKCVFYVLGSDRCEPEISCTINIPGDGENCDEHSVKITDGSVGEVVTCGKTKISGKASKGLRDLFIKVESEGRSGSVQCSAKCSPGDANRLDANIKRKVDPRCACGFQNKDDRIVGGEDAKMMEFPWMAALVLPGTRIPFCGATLINERFILTAAHCFFFDNKQPADFEVLMHALVLDMAVLDNANKNAAAGREGSIKYSGYNAAKQTDRSERSLRFQVQEIINHQLFDSNYDYDFSLLKLKKKVPLYDANSPTPICLPPPNTWDSLFKKQVGKLFTVIGWGKGDETAGASTRVLQKVEIPLYPWATCVERVPAEVLTKRMMCAGFEEGGKDGCTGDSGGPLSIQQTKNQFWQFGIVSWGEGCARQNQPSIYSRVTEGMQWITFHVAESDAKWCEGPKPLGPV